MTGTPPAVLTGAPLPAINYTINLRLISGGYQNAMCLKLQPLQCLDKMVPRESLLHCVIAEAVSSYYSLETQPFFARQYLL